ncbi:hypothetical protein [Lactococcus petauri]|uniref:hypothetical protein n=1 Tax=Lactococcus petauri TaxID=1940789 RepID=UPI0018A8A4A5|nr:hypothetical protein [Lactococcus petauri]MDC0825483.1 hypothetical protein [Lactococcus petauri]
MEVLQQTVKSNLIEVNEIIKSVFSGKSELTTWEIAEQVGEKIWQAAEIIGIELD